MGIFNNAKSITMNNKVVSSITTDTGVLYQKKVNTQLSIDVPLNLTYSDEFSITGVLSSNGVGVVGATVNLLVGSTVVDFTTTTTGGAYSFNNTPVSAGNHSFQVVFNGNGEYFTSESTIVNRVVAKETSVLLNVTPTGKIGFAQTGTGYNSVTPACILRTDDDEAIAYATIHFGDATDSTQIDGYAQGSDVTYPTTSVNIVYDGDSNYTASSVTANFEYQIPTLLNLSGTKTIISKDETATVNGMLYDQDGDIIPNCQLEYNIKHNNTIITSGTVRTDNNGAITLNYTGTGIGDVDITVSYGRLLQETYEIEDYLFYDDASTDKSSNYQTTLIQTSGTISLSHNTDKYVLSNSNNNTKAVKFLSDIPTDCIIEVDHNSGDNNIGIALMDNSNNTNAMCFNTYSTGYGAWKYNNGSWSNWYSGNYSQSSSDWIHVKITKQGTNLKIQYYDINDVLLATKEIIATTYSKYDVGICIGNTRTAYFKNIKFKAL